MSKKHFLFILLAAMFFVTCKKDDDNSKVLTPPCKLNQQSFFHPNATNSERSNLSFNADGFIEEIQRIQQPGDYYVNGQGPFQSTPDTSYLYFEYENGRVTKTRSSEYGDQRFTVFEYTGDLLTTSIDYFDVGVIEGYHLFSYDSQGHLIERIDSTTQANFKYVLEYDGDNLTSLEVINLVETPQKKSKTLYSNFDDQQNFALAIHGLPASFVYANNLHLYHTLSPNNYQFEQYHFPIPITEDYTDWLDYDYSYEYNADGFPTKMNYAGWEVSFTYECQ